MLSAIIRLYSTVTLVDIGRLCSDIVAFPGKFYMVIRHRCSLIWTFSVRRYILQIPLILVAGNEDPDQPARMRRLTSACVVRKVHKGPFRALRINCFKKRIYTILKPINEKRKVFVNLSSIHTSIFVSLLLSITKLRPHSKILFTASCHYKLQCVIGNEKRRISNVFCYFCYITLYVVYICVGIINSEYNN